MASAYATLYTDQDCIIPPPQTFAPVPSSVADIMPPPPPPPPTDEPGPSSGVRARSPPPHRTNFYSSQDSDMMIDQYGDPIPSTRRTRSQTSSVSTTSVSSSLSAMCVVVSMQQNHTYQFINVDQ